MPFFFVESRRPPWRSRRAMGHTGVGSAREIIAFRVQFGRRHRLALRAILSMKILVRLIAAALFVVFFDFALKNTDEVVLRLFWSAQAKPPLILLLLAFLIAGAALGVLAMTGTVMRYRRELARSRKELEQVRQQNTEKTEARTRVPVPDALADQGGL